MNIQLLKFDQVPLPVFKEIKGKDWVYYGEKNDYPEYLLRLYNNSAKHNALITGKVDYICGEGWNCKTDDEIEKAKIYELINNVNKTQESLNELTFKLTTDLILFGGFYLQVIWTQGTGEVAELYHIDYSKVRTNQDNSIYYVSDEWIKNGSINSRPEPKAYPKFDSENRKGTQILYFKEYRAGLNTYSLPDYRGGINYIELDICISEYHLNSINNGMFTSKMINFNDGKVSEEEEGRIEKMLTNKFTGSKNAGKFVLSFNENTESAPTILDLSGTELDKHFDLLNKTVQQEIFTSHNITSPMLFGIKTEGQLGGRNELREASELFQTKYISVKQKEIESIVNYLYSFNDITGKLELNTKEPIPFEFSETIISQNMTQEEIREKLGLPPIEKKESAGGQDVINALNSLSPLIATKVVESMDINELRMLIGLQPRADIKTPEEAANTENGNVEPTNTNMSCSHNQFSSKHKDQDIINLFKGKGIKKNNYFVLDSQKISMSDELLQHKFAEYNLTNLQKLIIEVIAENPTATITEISERSNVSIEVVDDNIKALRDSGVISEKETTKRGEKKTERKITPEAEKDLGKIKPVRQYKTLYSYEERKGVPKPLTQSRPLCEYLWESDLFFTRQEIEDISSQLGYSVFLLCGGYYNNPNTGKTTPYCRHEWKRNVVIEK
jgi:DNA-binding MarR family transcriptional regulator